MLGIGETEASLLLLLESNVWSDAIVTQEGAHTALYSSS